MASDPQSATAAADVVAVLRQSDLTQVFAKARPLTATIRETARIMQHPLETGAQIADHIVFDPIEITLPVVIPGTYKPVLDEIRQVFKAGTLLTIQTRSGNYANMVLSEMPHEETTEAFDAISVSLKFGEANFIKPTLGGPVPRKAKNANTTKRGQVQPVTPPAAARGSFLYRTVPVH